MGAFRSIFILWVSLVCSPLFARDHSCSTKLSDLFSPPAEEVFSTNSLLFRVRLNKQGYWIPVSDLANKHTTSDEYQTAKRFKTFLQSKEGQNLLLLSDYDGLSIPSFDGLIFDKNGLARFNLQIKKVKLRSVMKSIFKSIEKIERTSQDSGFWDHYVEGRKGHHWLAKILGVLGLTHGSKRRESQIVIDLGERASETKLLSLAEESQSALKRATKLIHSVIFLDGCDVIEVLREGIFWHEFAICGPQKA